MKTIPKYLKGVQARSRPVVPSINGIGLGGAPTLADVFVSPQSALTFTACFSAIRTISEDVASLPIRVIQDLPDGGSQLRPDHPTQKLLTESPNGEISSFNLIESWVSHVLGWGNAFLECERSTSGKPLALHLLHPSATRPLREDGQLYYQIQGSQEQGKLLHSDYVVHLAGLGFDGLVGYSPIAMCREAIGLGKALEEFGASVFSNKVLPGGILTYPNKLDDASKQRIRESLSLEHSGRGRQHSTMVLDNGMTWTPTSIAPEDAQFLATRQFQVLEIARIYRLPPHKLGDYSQSHLSNIEASNMDYLQTTLRGWLTRIERCLTLKLFSEAERKMGYRCKFDMKSLLRADSKTRSEYYQKMLALGVYTVNEIRALENLNPISEEAGGNLRFVPGNYAYLDGSGATIPILGSKQPDPAQTGQAPNTN